MAVHSQAERRGFALVADDAARGDDRGDIGIRSAGGCVRGSGQCKSGGCTSRSEEPEFHLPDIVRWVVGTTARGSNTNFQFE
jgi:hypothetical protein